MVRYNLESATKIFAGNGLILMADTYKNNKTPMTCRCIVHQEKIFEVSLESAMRTKRCPKCNKWNRYNIEDAKEIFKSHGYTLLESQYKHNKARMKCFCDKHPELVQHKTIRALLGGYGNCKLCSDRTYYDIEKAREVFDRRGYKLLDTKYINQHVKMRYICSNHSGSIKQIKLSDLLNGHGCMDCKRDNMRGENNFNWKGGVSSVNSLLRNQTREWSNGIRRDNDLRCDITGALAEDVHHVVSFSTIVGEFLSNENVSLFKDIAKSDPDYLKDVCDRFKAFHDNTAIGVCLTKDTHYDFHKKYGFHNNTVEQYKKFKKDYEETI